MKLIKSLGKRDDAINPSTGNMMKTEWYLFECPICLNQYEQRGLRGLKSKTCTKCKGIQKVTHGLAHTRQYTTWAGMVQRCTNPKTSKYHLYGGKGIEVCDKWKTFEGFWEDNQELYSDDLTIDRIDSSKGYTKDNVRWISKEKNSSETTKRRPVVQYRIALLPEKHLVEIQQWESAKCAADALGLVAAHITTVCSGKRSTHGGFAWKYL